MTRSQTPNRADEEKAAAAQTVFVIDAWHALPLKAHRQLLMRQTTETELTWATRWRVNAPCMVDYARTLRAEYAKTDRKTRQKLRRGLIRFDRRISVPLPSELLAELERLDRLPDWGFSLSDKVAPTHFAEYRRRKLADDEDLLARPGLKPWETDKHYAERTGDHRRARRLRFRRWGDSVRPRKPSPKLNEHVQWLVAFQVRGKEVAVIARSAGLSGAAGQTRVRKVIHDLAGLIGLSLRREPRGRPRVPPPSDLQEARLLRATLTRRFQEALNQTSGRTGPVYQAEISTAINDELPYWSLQQRKELSQHIKHLKPSDAAARLSARKFDVIDYRVSEVTRG